MICHKICNPIKKIQLASEDAIRLLDYRESSIVKIDINVEKCWFGDYIDYQLNTWVAFNWTMCHDILYENYYPSSHIDTC